MTKFRKSFRHGEKGFTLVELLIVVAILGILAAVAIPNLVAFIGTGQTEAESTELDVIQTATIALLAKAGVPDLDSGDGGYTNIGTYVQVQTVQATDSDSVTHSLDDFLMGTNDLLRAYNIADDGEVTVYVAP